MIEVNQLISSYLNARAAILRILVEKRLSHTKLADQLKLSYDVFSRKLKKSDWRADELSQLAIIIGVTIDLEKHLRLLNEHLQSLPEQDWKRLIKETHIGKYRIQSLMKDHRGWRHYELSQVSNYLSKYELTSNSG
ncbi:hypothetical protein [Spirosoma lituiforme]